jgi:exosortase/archaeosortase family protein
MLADETPQRSGLNERARFVLTFGGIAGLGLLLYCFPYRENGISEQAFDSFLAGYARLAYSLIRLFDPSAVLVGNEIHGLYAVRIVKGCDAMEAKILFIAAVLAFPTAWLPKLGAALAGLVALTVINVLRITSLYYAGLAFPKLVELLHLEVWPLLLVACAVLLFLWFTKLTTGRAAGAS